MDGAVIRALAEVLGLGVTSRSAQSQKPVA